MVSILCWLWDGRRPGVYNYRHVNALSKMLQKHISVPYELTCITDRPDGVECKTYPLWDFPKVVPSTEKSRNWDAYRRLRIFDPEVGSQFGNRIVSIDLDSLIRGDLSDLFVGDFGCMKGTVSEMNASLYTLKVGTHRHVWDTFNPCKVAKIIYNTKHKGRPTIGSDQGWMSVQIKDARLWDESDGLMTIKQIRTKGMVPHNNRAIFYAGDIKPWSNEMRKPYPKLYDEYMQYYD